MTDVICDLEQRISHVIKNDKLLFNIGDVIRITGLKRSQIHYWNKKGYIKTINNPQNSYGLYSYHMLIKIEVMQSYLKTGFTLYMANKRASLTHYYGNAISSIVANCFHGVTNKDGKMVVDFGPIEKDKELYFIVDPKNRNHVQKKIIFRN